MKILTQVYLSVSLKLHFIEEATMKTVGVIGGSGLYEMEGLTDIRSAKVETPWGNPSGD